MEAFQIALRRCLSSPPKACHWPFPDCSACEKEASTCGSSESTREPSSSPAVYTFPSQVTGAAKEADFKDCNEDDHMQVHLMEKHRKKLMLAEATESGSSCCCTHAQNCALIVSEDPLLRPSLLAMSVGVSQVHTVVMNHSKWESAVTIAKCFGQPDSLRMFRSLEALENEVFGERISRALSGEAVPPHTCRPGPARSSELSKGPLEPCPASSTAGANEGGNGYTVEDTLTADELQAHLHRYRLVLIDDHYCGPIVSAFGLTQLLQFCRTHTCWIAASGRAMGCSFVRVEDVSLSDRFCVFEKFETLPFKDSYHGSSCANDAQSSESSCLIGQSCAGECTLVLQEELNSSESLLKTRCFRCARDRQLSWTDKQRSSSSSGAVCGVEVEGSCAGFILRNHVLVDEGLPLPPSSPLMIFLPEEVPLTTGHIVILSAEPPTPKGQQSKAVTGVCEGSTTRDSSQPRQNSQGDQEEGVSPADSLKTTQEQQLCGADVQASETISDFCEAACQAQAESIVVPWRDLALQQPTFRWQCATIGDSFSESNFELVLTLSDLHQAMLSHANDQPQNQE
ncbi:hypothetical protein Emed_002011 [Eimeria media]